MDKFLAMRIIEGALYFANVPDTYKTKVAKALNEQGYGDLVTEEVPDEETSSVDMTDFF